MANKLQYGVLPSHRVKDGASERSLAERSWRAGLSVRFDKRETKLSDNMPAKATEGLERLCVLALCSSACTFESGQTQLATTGFGLRKPLNRAHRFTRLECRPPRASPPGSSGNSCVFADRARWRANPLKARTPVHLGVSP